MQMSMGTARHAAIVVVCAVALAAAAMGCRQGDAMKSGNPVRKAPTKDLKLPPLPILPPTALTADAGDGRAYLRWNLQLEDERIVGWKVVQLAPEAKTVTPDVLTEPAFVVRGLANGTACTFAAVGVLKDGSTTEHSNTATVTPRNAGTAKVVALSKDDKITVGEFKDVELADPAAKIVFPDGQELVFSRYRPADWKTRDGEHLIHPKVFGNGLDVGKFEKNGLPLVIPPEGLRRTTIEADGALWSTGSVDRFSIRWTGFVQPQFSEEYTFCTNTDDGVRLWVDNKLLIDRWVTQSPTEYRGTIKLEAGRKYPIKMEYFEDTGGAMARLAWSSAGQPREVIPAARLFPPQGDGNGLEGAYFDGSGFGVLKLTRVDQTIDFDWGEGGPFADKPAAFSYLDAQNGTMHPYITDPYTLSLQQYHHDARDKWFEPVIDGDRVTLHWWQPMAAMGYRSWVFVQVWETWWPIERDRHGAKSHGLARLVEVELPSALKDGYQVMLNNGFGPGGSRKGVVSYSSGFRRPSTEIVDFSGDASRQVYFQHPKQPRRGSYHPNQDCLQSSPLIFYDWGKGSLTIAARGLYYHVSQGSSSYVEQGVDGVWPNLAWDMAIAGKRTPVDTVEYLYSADMALPLPQRYANARFEALGDVSRRMGVQDSLAAASVVGSMNDVKRDGGPVAHAEKSIARYKDGGVDAFHIFHDFWHAVPVCVDDAYRLDENHDCNPQLKAMNDKFHAAGISPGFWYRPEFTKTAITNVLSDTMPTADTYYGYNICKYPDVAALLNERGIPIVRENTDWIRRQRDGSWPVNTPYQWVPMSMASDWWNRIMWPTLVMSRKLGFDWILMDGGFGGMQGVDYAPMFAGKTDSAVASQPYWWRMFRSMHKIGMLNYGECTLGWKGGFVNLTGPGDEYFIWMYQCSAIWGNDDLRAPEQLHKLFQLYNSTSGRLDAAMLPVCRYAIKFRKEHRPPDWIEFRDLKQAEARQVTVKVGESPVAGAATRISQADQLAFTVQPWTWSDVIWHYDDGTQVAYPAYEKIDWGKE